MKALKVLVVVMGVMIVAGVIGLGVVMTRRLTAAPPTTALPGMGSVTLDEPAGTRIAGAVAGGDTIVLHLQGGGPDRVAVVELRSGRVVGRIGLAR